MSRRIVIEIDLDELPRAIAESARAVFNAHGVGLHEHGAMLDSAHTARIIDEIGRNAAAPLALTEPREPVSVEAIAKLMRSWCSNWSEAEISAVAEDIVRLVTP